MLYRCPGFKKFGTAIQTVVRAPKGANSIKACSMRQHTCIIARVGHFCSRPWFSLVKLHYLCLDSVSKPKEHSCNLCHTSSLVLTQQLECLAPCQSSTICAFIYNWWNIFNLNWFCQEPLDRSWLSKPCERIRYSYSDTRSTLHCKRRSASSKPHLQNSFRSSSVFTVDIYIYI